MIAAGQTIDTAFTLKVVQDGEVREVVFRDLLTKPVIVSVYMKNNTGSCDKQNDSLVAHASEFAKAGYRLIALSRDTCGSHLKYAAKKNITYTLASDPSDAFARATDSLVEKSMYGRTFQGPVRAAYIINTQGKVLRVIEKVDTKDHSAQIKAALATL
ncbi:peroxiredoxin [Rariglobus hedericola]|uniref:thioredoxin-dependent peroxiredoxin n=1 Tax=Rariglobus hedericola TaxID=2597822 RepID=A0A556QKM2_9BACT|nr:redoxin domain-containing protein [Rariglobus hedericola]TSJ77205.1 redoxin domain-containing protein [Rariglobus hedericola]